MSLRIYTVFRSALRFNTNSDCRIHHCELYSLLSWPSLNLRRQRHCLVFIDKAILGKLLSCCLLLLQIQLPLLTPASSLQSQDPHKKWENSFFPLLLFCCGIAPRTICDYRNSSPCRCFKTRLTEYGFKVYPCLRLT